MKQNQKKTTTWEGKVKKKKKSKLDSKARERRCVGEKKAKVKKKKLKNETVVWRRMGVEEQTRGGAPSRRRAPVRF